MKIFEIALRCMKEQVKYEKYDKTMHLKMWTIAIILQIHQESLRIEIILVFAVYRCAMLSINHTENVSYKKTSLSYIFGPPQTISMHDPKKCNLPELRSKTEKCNLHF